MLYFLYVFLIVVNFIHILFSPKKVSFITIYFFSSLIYYLNMFFGQIYVSSNGIIRGYSLNETTYLIMIINMLIILLNFVIPNFSVRKDGERSQADFQNQNGLSDLKAEFTEKATVKMMSFVILILAIYTIIHFNLFSLTQYNKLEILNNSGAITTYFKSLSLFLFVYMFTQKGIKYGKLTYIFVLFSLFTTFLLGHRSYIVIGLIAIIFNYVVINIQNKKNLFTYLLQYKRLITLSFIFIFVIYSIKGIYVALFTGQFEIVKNRLTNLDYYINSFKISESNSIISYVDTVANLNYQVESSTYLNIPRYLIPVFGRFFSTDGFSDMLQRDIFTDAIPGTLGSSVIAEAFANGGLIMIFIIIFLVLLTLKFVYSFYKHYKNNLAKSFFLLWGVEFAFYIHRNSLDTALIRIRAYFYILILLLLTRWLFKLILKK